MKKGEAGLPKVVSKRLDSLAAAVLKDVKPTDEENRIAKRMINEVMARLKGVTPRNVEILLAGSVARGTNVRGNADIDIFLLFPRTMAKDAIEKKGLEIGKAIVDKKRNEKYSINYAEHPYTRIAFYDAGINVEVVPAYKIRNAKDMGTAVDRTQLHNEFVNGNMKERQRDDVRILKTFFNSHRIYGAEARIEGFSGYLCELLVYHFGSFNNVVHGLSRLRVPTVIDVLSGERITGHSKEAEQFVKRFSKSFVVIDPTDSNRNVAASVSDQSLARAILISRRLIESPTRDSFFGKGYSDTNSSARVSRIAKELGVVPHVLCFKLPEIAEDITWQQLKRLAGRVDETLWANGFHHIMRLTNADEKRGVIIIFARDERLESTILKGPSITMGGPVEQFLKAHKSALGTLLWMDKIYAIERPRYATPRELLQSFVSDKKIVLPSALDRKTAKLYAGKLPEEIAKMVYRAYWEKVNI